MNDVVGRFALILLSLVSQQANSADHPSHPPMRPLPIGNDHRPEPTGKLYFVDGNNGNDQAPGSKTQPWRTLTFAVQRLSPGDALVIRQGVYHERIDISCRGNSEKPITIRAATGELVVIDGGIPEFQISPSDSWEPLENGEYRSTKAFPDLGDDREGRTQLLGNFADSMIPLHGYRFITDLRSDNHLFHRLEGPKTAQGNGLYCGPGVFLEPTTKRIHVRLAPTRQPSLSHEENYSGETDPRKLSLVIAGGGDPPLSLLRAAHLVIQDIVVRGSRDATIDLKLCSNITFDGVTSYGGSSALRVQSTNGLRCINCAFRGIAAPWLWRWSLKYRSIEAKIVAASQWNPSAIPNRDHEYIHCEFTDCVDGVFVGNVIDCKIHRCLLDNVSDDGFFLTCRTTYDGSNYGDTEIYRNRISRVLTAFAYGVGHGRQKTIDEQGNKQLGNGVHAHHNLFDFRKTVQYIEPTEGPIVTYGRVAGDHGSPAWEPLVFERNTVFNQGSPWRNYYAGGWGKAMGKGTRRTIRHNIFFHETGMPGEVLPDKPVNLEAEHNVHWSAEACETGKDIFLKRFRNSKRFTETGWTEGDRYESPILFDSEVGASANIPVGQFGRYLLDGSVNPTRIDSPPPLPFRTEARDLPKQKVALILGYPAFDAPLLIYALEKQGVTVDIFDKQWLPAQKFDSYDLIAFLGNTLRAKMQPSGFSSEELPFVQSYLIKGGKLFIGRELTGMLFPDEDGKRFVRTILGESKPNRQKPKFSALQPEHPWIDHLDDFKWLESAGASRVFQGRGTSIIGDASLSASILADLPVGNGRFVYMGWEASRFLPHGRKPSSIESESLYEDQYQVLEKMVRDLLD